MRKSGAVIAFLVAVILFTGNFLFALPDRSIDFININAKWNGWEGRYNKIMEDWTFEKYTVNPSDPDGIRDTNIFYVTDLLDKPDNPDDFKKHLIEKDWLSFNYHWTSIDSSETLSDGFVITGKSLDYTDESSKPELSFVVVRIFKNKKVFCMSSIIQSEVILQEAIDYCRSL